MNDGAGARPLLGLFLFPNRDGDLAEDGEDHGADSADADGDGLESLSVKRRRRPLRVLVPA